jgi:hypothetical protein
VNYVPPEPPELRREVGSSLSNRWPPPWQDVIELTAQCLANASNGEPIGRPTPWEQSSLAQREALRRLVVQVLQAYADADRLAASRCSDREAAKHRGQP